MGLLCSPPPASQLPLAASYSSHVQYLWELAGDRAGTAINE